MTVIQVLHRRYIRQSSIQWNKAWTSVSRFLVHGNYDISYPSRTGEVLAHQVVDEYYKVQDEEELSRTGINGELEGLLNTTDGDEFISDEEDGNDEYQENDQGMGHDHSHSHNHGAGGKCCHEETKTNTEFEGTIAMAIRPDDRV